MKASEARKLIGKRVEWDDTTRTTTLGFIRVDRRGGNGILEDVQGRNVVIGGDYLWLPDLTNLREAGQVPPLDA